MNQPPKSHIPFFRIFYSTTFTLFSILLAALLLITPGDHIYQSFQAGQLYHIIIVGAVYVLTFVLSVFIYASRLFSTRSALAGIPREWSLNGNGLGDPGIGLGMGHRMGRVVREGLERSAIISHEGRPRDLRGEEQVRHIPSKQRKRKALSREERQGSGESNTEPVWGTIAHAGWASPESSDLPSLQFEPVVVELGHLIEAKAVSLAPVDPLWDGIMETTEGEDVEESAPPDPLAVELLQRSSATGIREYVSHLTTIGMITPAHLGSDFIRLYERARFSGNQLKENDFRQLMAVFAEILGNMLPLEQHVLEGFRAAYAESLSNDEGSHDTNDGQSSASDATTKHTPYRGTSIAPSVASQTNTHPTAHTAPSRPGTARDISGLSQRSHSSSGSVIRHAHKSKPASLRTTSTHSLAASSPGSVIRLARARTPLDLPYTFVDGSREEL